MDKNTDPEKESLVIPTRWATAYAAVALSVLSGFFVAGYFFGKNHAIDQVVAQVEQSVFSDHIGAPLSALYDETIQQRVVDSDSKEISGDEGHRVAPFLEKDKPQFYAQLIGYGTHKAAARFSDKLQKEGIPVAVKTRTSTTTGGKKVTWYQVVTEPFTDRAALEELTQQIARHEKIQGIQVLSC